MNCSRCGQDTRVVETRTNGTIVRRRRVCENGHRIVTYESTHNPERDREVRRAAAIKRWHRKSAKERSLIKSREHRRAEARAESNLTGEAVDSIYARWGVD